MSINLSILLIIIGCAIVTVIPRVIPFIMIRNSELPPKLVKWLSYIPICIFTALIVDSMIIDDSASLLAIDWTVVMAILPTLIVAIWTRSLSLTVIVGIVTMALIRFFL
jgi:branched-subunit amino acid transport protein